MFNSAPGRSIRLPFAFALLTVATVAPAPPTRAAVITVDTLTDVDAFDGVCAFREALVAADTDTAHGDCPAGSGVDRILFGVTGTIDLASDLPILTKSVTIEGTGGADLVIGGNFHRILQLDGEPDGQTLTVSGVVLRQGRNVDAGGCLSVGEEDRLLLTDARVLQCVSESAGGGVAGMYAASVRIVRSRISNNRATDGGGGVVEVGLAAMPEAELGELQSELRIEDSTIAGNAVSGKDVGGGIGVLFARLSLVRSTVSGNEAPGPGGGIYAGASEVGIESSTVVLNEGVVPAPLGATPLLGVALGGGLYAASHAVSGVGSSVTVHNSLFAGNLSGGNQIDLTADPSSTIASLGWNLISTNFGVPSAFPAGEPNAAEDWVGTTGTPLPHGLGPLVNNGGPTFTHLPLPGSIAIDRGSCPGARRDQRGYGDAASGFRAVDDPSVANADAGCDIGAAEAGAVELPFLLFIDGLESGDVGAWSDAVG